MYIRRPLQSVGRVRQTVSVFQSLILKRTSEASEASQTHLPGIRYLPSPASEAFETKLSILTSSDTPTPTHLKRASNSLRTHLNHLSDLI